MPEPGNKQILLVIKHWGFFNVSVHFLSIFILLGMSYAFVIVDKWHWWEWVSLFVSLLLFLNTKNLQIYTVFNKEQKTITSKRFTLFGIFSSKLKFSDVKRIKIERLYWGRRYPRTPREDLWLCLEDDEILIINSKKSPPGVAGEEVTIRQFIGLLEDPPDKEKCQ